MDEAKFAVEKAFESLGCKWSEWLPQYGGGALLVGESDCAYYWGIVVSDGSWYVWLEQAKTSVNRKPVLFRS